MNKMVFCKRTTIDLQERPENPPLFDPPKPPRPPPPPPNLDISAYARYNSFDSSINHSFTAERFHF